jgi:hypothetical protein
MQDNQLQKLTTASKTGSKAAVIIQARDRTLMQALAILRILDRKQSAALAGFKSLTRINGRLLKLTSVGLLKRFFFVSALGGKRAIYCLSKKGAELFDLPANGINRPKDSFLIGDKFISHQLAINEVYLALHSPHIYEYRINSWRSFSKPVSSAVPILPDAYFELGLNDTSRPLFLEVDQGTEALSVWTKKIDGHLSLATTGEFERLFQKPRFAVLVVTSSERRMQSLRDHIRKTTTKLFYFSTLEKITAQGFFSPIWLRSEGQQTQSLI